ncbi:MAG: ComF family protein [Spirochaetes bacterium]|nr:MAG: ComF family protein [Spirochaetota bacterium]
MNGTRLLQRAQDFLSYVFPSRCAVCGVPVSIRDRDACPRCLASIERVRDGCPRCCGAIIDGECTVCGNRAFYPDRNICAGEYRGTLETLIRGYKFGKRARLHAHLSDLAYEALGAPGLAFDCVSAVPMDGKKRWKRGFNQSELVARALARRLGIPYRDLLKERPGSLKQKEMRRTDRFINVLERYEVARADLVAGKNILLVDDILTTGATLNECSRVLKGSGAGAVYTLTIARAGIKKLENLLF